MPPLMASPAGPRRPHHHTLPSGRVRPRRPSACAGGTDNTTAAAAAVVPTKPGVTFGSAYTKVGVAGTVCPAVATATTITVARGKVRDRHAAHPAAIIRWW